MHVAICSDFCSEMMVNSYEKLHSSKLFQIGGEINKM
jgi:hypothetical protein